MESFNLVFLEIPFQIFDYQYPENLRISTRTQQLEANIKLPRIEKQFHIKTLQKRANDSKDGEKLVCNESKTWSLCETALYVQIVQ